MPSDDVLNAVGQVAWTDPRTQEEYRIVKDVTVYDYNPKSSENDASAFNTKHIRRFSYHNINTLPYQPVISPPHAHPAKTVIEKYTLASDDGAIKPLRYRSKIHNDFDPIFWIIKNDLGIKQFCIAGGVIDEWNNMAHLIEKCNPNKDTQNMKLFAFGDNAMKTSVVYQKHKPHTYVKVPFMQDDFTSDPHDSVRALLISHQDTFQTLYAYNMSSRKTLQQFDEWLFGSLSDSYASLDGEYIANQLVPRIRSLFFTPLGEKEYGYTFPRYISLACRIEICTKLKGLFLHAVHHYMRGDFLPASSLEPMIILSQYMSRYFGVKSVVVNGDLADKKKNLQVALLSPMLMLWDGEEQLNVKWYSIQTMPMEISMTVYEWDTMLPDIDVWVGDKDAMPSPTTEVDSQKKYSITCEQKNGYVSAVIYRSMHSEPIARISFNNGSPTSSEHLVVSFDMVSISTAITEGSFVTVTHNVNEGSPRDSLFSGDFPMHMNQFRLVEGFIVGGERHRDRVLSTLDIGHCLTQHHVYGIHKDDINSITVRRGDSLYKFIRRCIKSCGLKGKVSPPQIITLAECMKEYSDHMRDVHRVVSEVVSLDIALFDYAPIQKEFLSIVDSVMERYKSSHSVQTWCKVPRTHEDILHDNATFYHLCKAYHNFIDALYSHEQWLSAFDYNTLGSDVRALKNCDISMGIVRDLLVMKKLGVHGYTNICALHYLEHGGTFESEMDTDNFSLIEYLDDTVV